MPRTICVFPNDPLQAYHRKGEVKERYFNPLNLFDEVHVISLYDDDAPPEQVQAMAGDAAMFVHCVGAFPGLLQWRSLGYRRRLLRLMQAIRPDVVRAYNALGPGWLAVTTAKRLRVPSVVSLHVSYDDQRTFDPHTIARTSLFFERQCLRQADCVVCVSAYLCDYARKYGARRTEVIYNRVDTQRYHTLARWHVDTLERWNVLTCQPVNVPTCQPANVPTCQRANEDFTVLWVGRFQSQKCPAVVIQAVADLDVRLVMIGDGEQRKAMEVLVKRLEIQDRVTFIPSVPNSEIPRYYRSADVFAIATRYEGFCIPVLEAMAAGLPVVASDVPPIPEILGGTGYVVPNDPAAFRAAIKRLRSDASLRAELGRRARERAESLDASIMEQRERDLYLELIGDLREK
ncbi:MAG: glycosyltransferase family 4 protein [Abditibacteriales bacterium]|nr:glycosyltransferase family 4 protein [Abditibacteriales bacterium]MDW8365559.1 glycosyltransferase family 4 protein [Abditibacteriales bacterium]